MDVTEPVDWHLRAGESFGPVEVRWTRTGSTDPLVAADWVFRLVARRPEGRYRTALVQQSTATATGYLVATVDAGALVVSWSLTAAETAGLRRGTFDYELRASRVSDPGDVEAVMHGRLEVEPSVVDDPPQPHASWADLHELTAWDARWWSR